jgi:hypothetical protein
MTGSLRMQNEPGELVKHRCGELRPLHPRTIVARSSEIRRPRQTSKKASLRSKPKIRRLTSHLAPCLPIRGAEAAVHRAFATPCWPLPASPKASGLTASLLGVAFGRQCLLGKQRTGETDVATFLAIFAFAHHVADVP